MTCTSRCFLSELSRTVYGEVRSRFPRSTPCRWEGLNLQGQNTMLHNFQKGFSSPRAHRFGAFVRSSLKISEPENLRSRVCMPCTRETCRAHRQNGAISVLFTFFERCHAPRRVVLTPVTYPAGRCEDFPDIHYIRGTGNTSISPSNIRKIFFRFVATHIDIVLERLSTFLQVT
jgi:hypothetical protein